MKIYLNNIEEINMTTADEPNDTLTIILKSNFTIHIESANVPCLAIITDKSGTYLQIDA